MYLRLKDFKSDWPSRKNIDWFISEISDDGTVTGVALHKNKAKKFDMITETEADQLIARAKRQGYEVEKVITESDKKKQTKNGKKSKA